MIVALLFTLGGFAWKPDPFPPVTLFDEATVLLAMGTLALAFAALVQAVSGVETMNAAYHYFGGIRALLGVARL